MNTNYCRMLLKEKKFDELIVVLEKEFIMLYKEMLVFIRGNIPENESLIGLGNEVIKNYPMYQDIIIENENVINSGEYDYGDSIDILLESYNYLAKNILPKYIEEKQDTKARYRAWNKFSKICKIGKNTF